jgi:hypothetical protein
MHRSRHVECRLRQSHFCICKASWRSVVEFRVSRHGLAGDRGGGGDPCSLFYARSKTSKPSHGESSRRTAPHPACRPVADLRVSHFKASLKNQRAPSAIVYIYSTVHHITSEQGLRYAGATMTIHKRPESRRPINSIWSEGRLRLFSHRRIVIGASWYPGPGSGMPVLAVAVVVAVVVAVSESRAARSCTVSRKGVF